MEQQGIYERIKDRVGRLKAESQDHFFSEYLGKLDDRLIQEKHQLDLMETELDRSCQIYRRRMASMGTAAVPGERPQEMMQSAADAQEKLQETASPSAAADAQGTVSQPTAADARGTASQTMAADVQEKLQGAASQTAATDTQGTVSQSAVADTQVTVSQPAAADVPGTTQAVRQEMGQNCGTYSEGSFSQQALPHLPYAPSQATAQSHKNHEFTVGINVFGTIGVLFVLAALILLGANYMSSLVKELGLYAIGLLVWAVSELVIKKKNQTLSVIFSSLGVGSLYVTTMVNFRYLHNFDGMAAILITALITALGMFESRKKDAGIMRIICIGACMISFWMMDTRHMDSDMELFVYMVMIVLVQLLGIFLPVKKWAYGIAIGQMAGTAVFAWIFAIFTIPPEQVMELRAIYVIGFLVVSMLLMELMVWRMPAENPGQMQGICVTFGIGAFLLVCAHFWCATGIFGWHSGTYDDLEIWVRLGVMAAIAVMGLVFFFLTRHKGYLRWMQGYFVAGAALFMFGSGSNEQLSVTITLTILMILYKLLAYRMKPLWVADAIITVWTALSALSYHNDFHGYVLLCVLLLSILLMNHWQTFYELLITGTLVLYISMVLDNDLMLPMVIAVMWLASLLFNYVKRFAGKGILGFNITMLVMEAACYLGLVFFHQYDSGVMYLILTVLGLGIILFTFQPRFHMAVSWRGLAIAGFLTYMVLVTRFEYRITSSILLMVVGLLGIVSGFRQTDRKLRIYGLVLCMLMCFKITLFDFRVQLLQRIILFMAAGVVALIISGIYALMEKRYNKVE